MHSLKIIHIVENLDKGAVENWLVNVFIESRKFRPDWQWTFYCMLGREGRLDQMVTDAGGRIVYSPVTLSHKLSFLKHLRKELKSGHYDIIHAHHDYLSGFYLLGSAGIHFKKRFLHIHNTDRALPVGNKVVHDLLLRPFRFFGTQLTDTAIGISQHTLAEFVKSDVRNDSRRAILYYGIDMRRFEIEALRDKVRSDLSLPAGSRILLFAGRMNELKNPVFVVDILDHLLKKRNDVYAVFVGSGDLEKDVRDKANIYGISDHIRILGWHDNVPLLMKSSDVFVFPRKLVPKEGLGLVVVEAQAAGIPMFITKGVADDAIEIPELTHFNDPTEPEKWAQQIDKVLNTPAAISQAEALRRMKASKFELHNAAKNLVDLYER